MLAESPKSENTLVLSGFTKASLGNFSAASTAYKKALSVNDKNIMARQGYALALVSLGKKDDAAKLYAEILSKYKTTPAAQAAGENTGVTK